MKYLLFLLLFISFMCLGQSPLPVTSGDDFAVIFGQIVKLFGQWNVLSYQYKISAILLIIVSLIKHSALRPLWDKLGKYKALLAPVLSLIAFLFLVQPFTFQTFIAAITTGAAASYFSQVIKMLKDIPQLNIIMTIFSDILDFILKRPKK